MGTNFPVFADFEENMREQMEQVETLSPIPSKK